MAFGTEKCDFRDAARNSVIWQEKRLPQRPWLEKRLLPWSKSEYSYIYLEI
jgi:hypothetical protein